MATMTAEKPPRHGIEKLTIPLALRKIDREAERRNLRAVRDKAIGMGSVEVGKHFIDAAVRKGDWIEVSVMCEKTKLPEVGKHAVDKMVKEGGHWILIGNMAKMAKSPEVREYASEQQKKRYGERQA